MWNSPSESVSSQSEVSGFDSVGVADSTVSPPVRKLSDGVELMDEFESFFEGFWAEIAIFSFEKANEIAVKEKERALKTHVQANQGSSSGFTWVILTTAMAQIAFTEKAYVNLTFLAPKGFLRKDSNLKSTLESIRFDLKKIAESSVSITSLPARHRNSEVASALLTLVNLRLDMMEFYEKLSLYGTAKNVEITDLLADMEIIQERFNEEKLGIGESLSILNGIVNSLNWECQVIMNLIKAINSIETWEYLEATLALQLANEALLKWNELVQTNYVTVKKSSFYSSTPSFPALFLWIKKLKGTLISKYTLYFYELLSKYSNPSYDIKVHSAKLPADYYSRITSFQRKSDALSVCIVFDARGTNFYRNGYRFPSTKTVEPVQGLDSYPAIVSVPAKPLTHWPSVVMIINDRAGELSANKCVGFFDTSAQATYFAEKIDGRMYLIVIYESKKSEKDSYTQKFMYDLVVELKCSKIFSGLKCFK